MWENPPTALANFSLTVTRSSSSSLWGAQVLPVDFGGPVEQEAAAQVPTETAAARDFYAGEGVGMAHGPGLGLDAQGARGQASVVRWLLQIVGDENGA